MQLVCTSISVSQAFSTFAKYDPFSNFRELMAVFVFVNFMDPNIVFLYGQMRVYIQQLTAVDEYQY